MSEDQNKGTEVSAKGELQGSNIIVSVQSSVDSLAQNGYGTRVGKTKLSLALYEALFLLDQKRLVVSFQNDDIGFAELLRNSRSLDKDIWTRYILYRDLRSRGYVVRESSVGGIGFRVYDRGDYPKKAAKYVVYPIMEGASLTIGHLADVLRSAEGAKKKLITAVIDRHGETIYYSLTQYSPN